MLDSPDGKVEAIWCRKSKKRLRFQECLGIKKIKKRLEIAQSKLKSLRKKKNNNDRRCNKRELFGEVKKHERVLDKKK